VSLRSGPPVACLTMGEPLRGFWGLLLGQVHQVFEETVSWLAV
jgi:hypothetical protein